MKTKLYRHFDKEGRLLYIGISNNVLRRTDNHAISASWFDEVATITITPFLSREEAEAEERKAIKEEQPIYNICHNNLPMKALGVFKLNKPELLLLLSIFKTFDPKKRTYSIAMSQEEALQIRMLRRISNKSRLKRWAMFSSANYDIITQEYKVCISPTSSNYFAKASAKEANITECFTYDLEAMQKALACEKKTVSKELIEELFGDY